MTQRSGLFSALRNMYGQVLYSHKIQEKAAEIALGFSTWLRILQIIATVLTAGSAISTAFASSKCPTEIALDCVSHGAITITAILASIALALELTGLRFSPEKSVEAHRRAAERLWSVRERLLRLVTDLNDGATSEQNARTERDSFMLELDAIYRDAPRTSALAYRKAQRSLKVANEATFSEDELNKLIPPGL
jgi:hypothetical protein